MEEEGSCTLLLPLPVEPDLEDPSWVGRRTKRGKWARLPTCPPGGGCGHACRNSAGPSQAAWATVAGACVGDSRLSARGSWAAHPQLSHARHACCAPLTPHKTRPLCAAGSPVCLKAFFLAAVAVAVAVLATAAARPPAAAAATTEVWGHLLCAVPAGRQASTLSAALHTDTPAPSHSPH